MKGSNFRIMWGAMLLGTLMYSVDQDKHIFKLGFTTSTPFASTYKMRPDYMTQTVFAAERKDVKSYADM